MNRLSGLLRFRRHQEDQADATLAAATRRRLAAESDHAAAREALLRSDAMVASEPRPRDLPELLAMRLQGMAAHERVIEAADVVAQRVREEMDARAARVAAAQRRRSAERLIERRDHEQFVLAQRAARNALGELARLRAVQP